MTQRGAIKWSANCEACFGYLAKRKSDCAICMRVCSVNRRGQFRDRIWFRMATGRFGAVGVRLAHAWQARSGPRPRLKPRDWRKRSG